MNVMRNGVWLRFQERISWHDHVKFSLCSKFQAVQGSPMKPVTCVHICAQYMKSGGQLLRHRELGHRGFVKPAWVVDRLGEDWCMLCQKSVTVTHVASKQHQWQITHLTAEGFGMWFQLHIPPSQEVAFEKGGGPWCFDHDAEESLTPW